MTWSFKDQHSSVTCPTSKCQPSPLFTAPFSYRSKASRTSRESSGLSMWQPEGNPRETFNLFPWKIPLAIMADGVPRFVMNRRLGFWKVGLLTNSDWQRLSWWDLWTLLEEILVATILLLTIFLNPLIFVSINGIHQQIFCNVCRRLLCKFWW